MTFDETCLIVAGIFFLAAFMMGLAAFTVHPLFLFHFTIYLVGGIWFVIATEDEE